MEKMMKECMKPHPLLHIVSGVGLGVLVANWFGGLVGETGVWVGLALVVGGVVGEFMFLKK